MNKINIGKILKNLRLDKGVTVKDVANACNITPQAVCQYESGDRIPKDEIKIRLADYFGVTVESIFFDFKCNGA